MSSLFTPFLEFHVIYVYRHRSVSATGGEGETEDIVGSLVPFVRTTLVDSTSDVVAWVGDDDDATILREASSSSSLTDASPCDV